MYLADIYLRKNYLWKTIFGKTISGKTIFGKTIFGKLSSEKLSLEKLSSKSTTLNVEKSIPKRKLIQSEEDEKSTLIIQTSSTQRKMFKCINVYSEDITHLKKGTISRPHNPTYDELKLTEQVKTHFQRIIEEINSNHYLGNSTYSFHYGERGLFNNDEILNILHEMGIFSIGKSGDFNLVTSDHTTSKLSYVASLALGGKDGCQKLFRHSLDLFTPHDPEDTPRLPILHSSCAENINYYSNLWRKHLAHYLP
jgi:hypothetical protein